jgi:hypothetical protein
LLIENATRQQGGNRVATVGELRCLPGAVNVIPGEVRSRWIFAARRMRRWIGCLTTCWNMRRRSPRVAV